MRIDSEKELQALNLLKEGLSYRKIASTLGIGVSTAHRIKNRFSVESDGITIKEKLPKEKSPLLKSIEVISERLTRIEEMLQKIINNVNE